jgi:hypothetical protein
MNRLRPPANSRNLVLLAPSGLNKQFVFQRTFHNFSLYESLKAKMQRLRGRLYFEDGAITENEISPDGRHVLATDDESWHLLTVGSDGDVLGCTRYLQHSDRARFDDLRISQSPLAYCETWGTKLRAAVEEDLRHTRSAGLSYVEVGGWAMAEQVRCTAECLRSVLATYAWSRLIGGAIGISTATERNGSASILRRLGGRLMNCEAGEIPPYHDSHYDCRMHMLRYDSREPNPRYEEAIESIGQTLAGVPLICPDRPASQPIFGGFAASAFAALAGNYRVATEQTQLAA